MVDYADKTYLQAERDILRDTVVFYCKQLAFWVVLTFLPR